MCPIMLQVALILIMILVELTIVTIVALWFCVGAKCCSSEMMEGNFLLCPD